MAEKPRVLWNEEAFDSKALKPDARLGAATIRFTGATGLVGTAFGIPGVTATRVATGHYRVQMPRAPQRSQQYWAQCVVPTGFQGPTAPGFQVTVAHRSPASGTVDLLTSRNSPTGVGGSFTGSVVNPTNDSEIDLFVFTSPITRY